MPLHTGTIVVIQPYKSFLASSSSDDFQSAIFCKFVDHISVFFGAPCGNVSTNMQLWPRMRSAAQI